MIKKQPLPALTIIFILILTTFSHIPLGRSSSGNNVFLPDGNNLIVTNDTGITSNGSKNVTLPNNQSMANFTIQPPQPIIHNQVFFNDSSFDPNSTIVKWDWDFGDKSTSIGERVTHCFNYNQTYLITLTVTDNHNVTDVKIKLLTVRGNKLTANFSIEPIKPTVNNIVYYNDTSNDTNEVIISYEWNFGDGSTPVYIRNTTHQYTKNGTYKIIQIITNENGIADTCIRYISVTEQQDGCLSCNESKYINSTPVSITENTDNCSSCQNSTQHGFGYVPVNLSDLRPEDLKMKSLVEDLTAPASWDWRNAEHNGIIGDWTTPAKNQGGCGSCWDFAAMGALEAMINIANNDPTLDYDLSEQYILSCYSGSWGCNGDDAYNAFHYLLNHGGAIPESCF